jgi:hypothetical protein
MANWVDNTLVVTKGDPKVVWDAIKGEETLFDFNRIVPGIQLVAYDTLFNPRCSDTTLWFDTCYSVPERVMVTLFAMFPNHEFEYTWESYEAQTASKFTIAGGEVVKEEELTVEVNRDGRWSR